MGNRDLRRRAQRGPDRTQQAAGLSPPRPRSSPQFGKSCLQDRTRPAPGLRSLWDPRGGVAWHTGGEPVHHGLFIRTYSLRQQHQQRGRYEGPSALLPGLIVRDFLVHNTESCLSSRGTYSLDDSKIHRANSTPSAPPQRLSFNPRRGFLQILSVMENGCGGRWLWVPPGAEPAPSQSLRDLGQ